MRRLEIFKVKGKNSLQHWYKVKNPLRVVFDFIIIYTCRYLPSLSLKNFLYRLVGVKIGKDVSIGLAAVFDIFFPELIEIGDNSIVGYGVTIIAHEFLVKEWRKGRVKIGKNVMVGANSTIVAGVTIGDGATISACSLVNDDVPRGAFVGGVPARILKAERK